jgi:hypothetical protein
MAIAKGTKNPKQAALLSALVVVIILLAGWEIRTTTSSATVSTVSRQSIAERTQPSGTPPKKATFTGNDFHLRLQELARSESVDYASDGRNVFSKMVAAVAVEPPLAPARPLPIPSPMAAPESKHVLPSMDLKYLGFAESNPGRINALFMHGDDIFIATTGDIMFHRFRVGTIQTSSVQVTDLVSNRTQAIAITN